jgi:hypothetical protein
MEDYMKRMLLALVGIGLLTAGMTSVQGHDDGTIRFTVDVAEDFSKFVPTPVNPGDTEPKRGAWFLTEGRIFPKGTIQGDGSTFDPGSGGAIGTWMCRGSHLISLTEIMNGGSPWVVTSQNYLLGGDNTIATDGQEGTGKFIRSVTGGTGRYRDYIGEQQQVLLGFNSTGGVNLRVTFILRRAANR